MKNFTYYRPQTAEQAVALLDNAWGTTELLGGGTDLLDLQKQYIAQPDKIVSVSGIGKLKEKFKEQDVEDKKVLSYEIGAGVKIVTIADSPTLRKAFPALTTAAGDVAGPQIRNMATLGGNLCQRNRCWYFRDEHVKCLLKGGDKCFALDGENRYHAVFTKGHPCVIVNPSTLAPVLIALRATVQIMGPSGKTRSTELASFYRAPRSPRERETSLAPNEMVVSVTIPNTGAANGSYEVRHKQAFDWPVAHAAVAFQHKDGKATDVEIVLGHVHPTPLVSRKAAAALEGKEVTEASAAAAGKAAAEGATPLSQNGYKVKLIEVAVKRAILIAAGQKKYWEA